MDISQLLKWKNEGLTPSEIAKRVGKDPSTIRYRYNKAGVEFNRWERPSKWNLYKVFNDYDVDGQYVIGLLAADGYITTGERSIAIFLKEDDATLLGRISFVLGNMHPTLRPKINSNGSKQLGMCIGSVELVRFLKMKYGFQSQKSRTLPFPKHLKNPLPYLRGYFDGNGHMGLSCTFTVGSKDFALGLLDWVKQVYGYEPNVQMVGMNKDVFNIHFRKKHERFIRDLFQYPGLYRKTEAFMRYLPN